MAAVAGRRRQVHRDDRFTLGKLSGFALRAPSAGRPNHRPGRTGPLLPGPTSRGRRAGDGELPDPHSGQRHPNVSMGPFHHVQLAARPATTLAAGEHVPRPCLPAVGPLPFRRAAWHPPGILPLPHKSSTPAASDLLPRLDTINFSRGPARPPQLAQKVSLQSGRFPAKRMKA